MPKNIFERVIAFILMLLLSPLLVFIAAGVRLLLGTPVIFSQRRPGLHGIPFSLYKFRTMTNAKDTFGNLFSDFDRLTSFGRFLRSTSLDELPELFNVLRGDMRLVGPRPLLMEYLPFYSKEENRRHQVYPGITGWAQVNGRNSVNWDERLAMDVWYVDNKSFVLDIKIICMTIKKVLCRDGVVVVPGTKMQDLNDERNAVKK